MSRAAVTFAENKMRCDVAKARQILVRISTVSLKPKSPHLEKGAKALTNTD